MNHEHEPIVEGGPHPTCRYCPPIPTHAPLTKLVAVGFGSAIASCDGETVADGEYGAFIENGKPRRVEGYITFADIEALAVLKPNSDWRIALHGPLHGEVYQRQGPGLWSIIERDEGFA